MSRVFLALSLTNGRAMGGILAEAVAMMNGCSLEATMNCWGTVNNGEIAGRNSKIYSSREVQRKRAASGILKAL